MLFEAFNQKDRGARMRTVTDDNGFDIHSLMYSIKKDRKSWEGWLCLKVEIPDAATRQQRERISGNMGRIFSSCLSDRQVDIFCEHEGSFLIFCKDIQERALEDVGRNIVNYALQEDHVCAHFIVYDLSRDAESFMDIFPVSLFSHTYVKKGVARASSGKAAPASLGQDHPKVLLVEDDPVTRWLVRTSLKNTCHLATAQEAYQAMHLYQVYKPDVVFLDINLPGKNGMEVLETLIRMDPGAHIVMFSGLDGIENIASAIEKGAQGFIAKPFNKEKLLYYIGREHLH
jgi:two-component system chemotaxis response regulator CheY